jgi:hypothetical protein
MKTAPAPPACILFAAKARAAHTHMEFSHRENSPAEDKAQL